MGSPAPPIDPAAEQEVDFGRYWRLIAARWWLPVGGLVLGLIVGYLVSLGTNSTTYKATALVYLGQPLAPDGAAPVSSAPTTLGLVSNLITSAATVREAAERSGPEARAPERAHHDEAGARDHRRPRRVAGPAARDHRHGRRRRARWRTRQTRSRTSP